MNQDIVLSIGEQLYIKMFVLHFPTTLTYVVMLEKCQKITFQHMTVFQSRGQNYNPCCKFMKPVSQSATYIFTAAMKNFDVVIQVFQ